MKEDDLKTVENFGFIHQTEWARLCGVSKSAIVTKAKKLGNLIKKPPKENPVLFRGYPVYPYSLASNQYSGSEHSLLVTECLIDIMLAYPESKFRREPDSPIHQPDAAVVVKEGTREALILLEVAKTELLTTLYSKINHYQSIDVSSFFVGLSYRTSSPWGILIVTDKKISIDRPGVRVVNKFRKEIL